MEIFCENPDEPWDDLRVVSNDIAGSYFSDPGPQGCYDALVRPYRWDAYSVEPLVVPVPPMPARPPLGDDPGDPGTPAVSGVKELPAGRYRCGWAPAYFKTEKWPVPLGYTNPWYSTRYNAADSFYSFAVEWKLGGDFGSFGDGCAAMLLPYRPLLGGAISAVFPDTSRWRVGRVPSSACEAEPGVDSVDLLMYSPPPPSPPTGQGYRARLAYGEKWDRYPDHSMHFAVYLSGMPSALDYRLDTDSGGAGDGGGSADWRLVSLGSWVYDEDGKLLSGSYGGRSLLGVAHPVGAGVSADGGGFDSVPTVSDLYDGLPVTVTRDFANDGGEVDVYVVPCRPLQSGAVPVADDVWGACEHLPSGRGHVRSVTFERGAGVSGPFGLVEPSAGNAGYKLQYSVKFRVRFRGSAWHDNVERRVSLPVEEDAPAGNECVVSSAVEVGSLYWPERLVSGGACDRDTLDVARVVIRNDGLHGISGVDSSPSGGRLDRLVVYVTGGRSHRLDLTQVNRAGLTYDGASPLGRLGVRERLLSLDYGSSGVFHVSPDLADESGDVWLLAYSCGADNGGARFFGAWGHCPWVGGFTDVYDVSVPPSFVVRVSFTSESGLEHADLGPVCQGDDCARRVPVLRLAGPDAPDGSCGASSYPSSPSGGLVYWPDRLVFGGECSPNGLEEVSVAFHNATDLGGQRLVVFATGGRSPGLGRVQVMRAGQPAGRTGLRRVEFSLEQGETGRVLVGPDLADDAGFVWLLAYRCEDGSGGSDSCLEATSGGDLVTYAVKRRPLFQVLVWYDAGLLRPAGFSICKGDDCLTSYELERFEEPTGLDCAVSASHSQGSLYWPDRVVAGGACDRYDLDDVAVQFRVPASTSEERLVVYVTGGRSLGLERVSVRRTPAQSSAGVGLGRRDVFIPFPDDTDVDSYATRASVSATVGVLDGKHWVQDGLVGVERRIYEGMQQLAGRYSGAELVAAMPFLDSVDETDYLTVRALISAWDIEAVDTIVDHPEFSGGITDSDRILVIGASLYAEDGVDAVTNRLDDGHYMVEERSFSTTETPRLLVSIARDRSSAGDVSGAAGMVRNSVDSMEAMMGRSFPVSHIIFFLDDGLFGSRPNTSGVNYGGMAFSVNPDVDRPAATVIHEVGHYFWNGGRIWIDEGMADTAVAAFGSALGVPDDELFSPKGSCGFDNLSELDAVLSPSNDGGDCPYYLGQRLFWDLRETLGFADFRAGVRRLYEALLANKAQGSAWGTWATINDLRAAFSDSEVAQDVITRHWSGVAATPVVAESAILGRLGLRQQLLTVPVDGSDTVYVSPDLAGPHGDVWLLAYRCDSVHGQSGCPMLSMPVRNGYHLPEGPDFAVRVRFTPASGLAAAELQRVCLGSYCDFYDPWLRRAEPSIDECAVQLGVHWDFWPDRVIRGGGCYFRGARYGPVAFRSAVEEKFVVYTTGGDERGLELVPVYGVLGDGSSSGVESDGVPLGQHGLRESSIELDSGGEEQVWVRADMADDDGNVWLFVYRCLESYNDAGCPLVDRDQVRPSYDLPVRPAFVVRMGFLDKADLGRSTIRVDCSTGPSECKIIAMFRTADGETLPGTAEFRVDNGSLGVGGSAGQVSRHGHETDAAGDHRFEETLVLPPPGNVVNIEAELLGDGLVLRLQEGLAGNLDRLSVRVMRCSGDEITCHAGGLEEVKNLLAGDRFVLQVTGYDAAGNEALSSTTLSYAGCVAGPSSPWPEFRLNSDYLRSHGYGTTQPDDRGYAGCAVHVLDDAPVGTYSITVSYGSVNSQVQIVVAEDTSKFGYLSLRGPSHLESGESGTYRVRGFTLAGEPSGFEGGCVELNLTGALERGESGTAMDGCLAQDLPVAGVEFTVRAAEGVLYQIDSSVGVSYGGRSVRQHILVSPADDDSVLGQSGPTASHISDLSIVQEGRQLKLSWVSDPTSEFASMRVLAWLQVGGEDVFLPGCEGGEVFEITTYEVFCLLSYGQSGDVYRAAVVFIRFDNSAMPVETAEWTRP